MVELPILMVHFDFQVVTHSQKPTSPSIGVKGYNSLSQELNLRLEVFTKSKTLCSISIFDLQVDSQFVPKNFCTHCAHLGYAGDEKHNAQCLQRYRDQGIYCLYRVLLGT